MTMFRFVDRSLALQATKCLIDKFKNLSISYWHGEDNLWYVEIYDKCLPGAIKALSTQGLTCEIVAKNS